MQIKPKTQCTQLLDELRITLKIWVSYGIAVINGCVHNGVRQTGEKKSCAAVRSENKLILDSYFGPTPLMEIMNNHLVATSLRITVYPEIF